MGRRYSITFSGVSLAAQQDLVSINPAADKPVRIVGIQIAQVGVGDVGDAQEELLEIDIVRGNTTTGSGGGSFTPTPLDASGQAAGATVRINDTTVASAGTGVKVMSDAFNIRQGYMLMLPEKIQPQTKNAVFMCVRLGSTPADGVTCCGTVWIEEEG